MLPDPPKSDGSTNMETIRMPRPRTASTEDSQSAAAFGVISTRVSSRVKEGSMLNIAWPRGLLPCALTSASNSSNLSPCPMLWSGRSR